MRRVYKERPAWQDRFTPPDVDELLAGLGKQQLQLIEHARNGLLALDDVTEKVTWLGIPWRWTLAYGVEGSEDRPWAYLVPQPGKPLLAIPMNSEMVKSLPMRRLPKFVRDVIAFSPRVAGVHWLQWELTGRGMVDDLLGLARRKHEVALSPAG
jgi:hypothetical protein